MEEMQQWHPLVFEQFLLGNHTVKCFEKKWAGIWTDLSIEQILRKSLKGRGRVIGRTTTQNILRVWTKTIWRVCTDMLKSAMLLSFVFPLITLISIRHYLANIYLFKVNNRSTRKRCETCSRLTIKTPERCRSGVFIVNFEHTPHLFLMFQLLPLNK